jgi:hypothetical protein
VNKIIPERKNKIFMMSGFTNGNAIFKITITKISQIYLKEKKS